MADPTMPQVAGSYLAQLRAALAGVPAGVRDEIVSGIREELDGLDAAAAAARIEALGDPEFIAAEARAEASLVTGPREPSGGSSAREPDWYPVVAALLVAFGGLVVPVVGWIVGLGLVWLSKTWQRRDKWVATLTPFAAAGLLVLVFLLTQVADSSPGEPGEPRIQGLFSAIWSSIVLAVPVNAVVGIWLLWRAKQARRSGHSEG